MGEVASEWWNDRQGEESISELCRRERIASNLYSRWSKDFLEAGKKQLAGDTGELMVRHGSGVFRLAEGRKQAYPQREEEAKNGPGLNCLRIAIVHESSQR